MPLVLAGGSLSSGQCMGKRVTGGGDLPEGASQSPCRPWNGGEQGWEVPPGLV